jgi:transposase
MVNWSKEDEKTSRDVYQRRRKLMSLQPEKLPEIPEETARVARILFPKGKRFMWLRDELGAIYHDEQFTSLYSNVGQLAEQPWRLAVMSIIQYMENYTDRQVAEALKTRIDLKYALSLELTDPGFDFSVLSEFRSRADQRRIGRSATHGPAHEMSGEWLVKRTRKTADRFDPY